MRITGRGIIEKGRKPGTFYVTHYLGEKDEKGRYKRAPRRLVKGTKSDAIRECAKYRDELEADLLSCGEKLTVSQYARKFHDERTLDSPLAYDREELEVRHIESLFGDTPLGNITAAMIRSAYARARKEREQTGRGWSEDTLYKTHVKLRQILKQAYQDELIKSNPADLVEFKRPAPAERKSLSLEEAQRLNDLIRSELTEQEDPRLVGLALILGTGIRRGEALGLHWRNVDIENSSVRIAEQYASDRKLRAPKSSESIRKLKIDANLLETLASWKNAQAQLLGITSEEQDDLPVISDTNGGLLDPDNYSRWFKSFCVKHNFGMWVDDKGNEIVERCNARGFPVDANGVPYSRSNKRPKRHYKGLKLHELRHTQATLLIANNADWKTVQHRLGHAQASTTMNIYAHMVEANDEAAANLIGSLLN